MSPAASDSSGIVTRESNISFAFLEMRIRSREIQETELGKLPEQGQVGFQVMNEFGHARLAALNDR